MQYTTEKEIRQEVAERRINIEREKFRNESFASGLIKIFLYDERRSKRFIEKQKI